jgi:hypothetical protein
LLHRIGVEPIDGGSSTGERFWCRVTAIAGDHITAVFDQDLLGSFRYGVFDKYPVTVTPSHVFRILDRRGTPIWEARRLPSCIAHRHISRESNT